MVDTPATEEGASLVTSRWYHCRDCRRRITLGCCCPAVVVKVITLAFPLTLAFDVVVGGGRRGRGATGGLDGSC
jgi:hypothetical protein